MPEYSPNKDGWEAVSAGRRRRSYRRWLPGLVVLALVRAAEVLAADQAPAAANAVKPDQNDWRQSTALSSSFFGAPDTYAAPSVAEPKFFSPKDFRPRGRTIFDSDLHLRVADDKLINDTTVWQRLSEYRTRDRVQVLTLWKSAASTVSLQTGKRGNPSLQWTSRLMNRGGATRGLLDRLFTVPTVGESKTARSAAHPMSPTGKGMLPLGVSRPGNAGSP